MGGRCTEQPPARIIHDDPPVQEAPTPRSALEERIGEVYEEMRALHEAGEIEWPQLSSQHAFEMAFLDD
jgi:hypothetical protein